MEYPIRVIYRACSEGNPIKERPIKDKLRLVQTCFYSFESAFYGLDYELTVLIDKPTPPLLDVFRNCDIEQYNYPDWDSGNIETFKRQIELGLKSGIPFLFVEDDYYFLPNSGKKIAEACHKLEFITPYDHPRYYDEEKHKYKRSIRIIGDHHWTTVSSTTLTFGGQYDSLVRWHEFMNMSGWADSVMWEKITLESDLWCPIPTLATHMETPHLAHCVKWKFANEV